MSRLKLRHPLVWMLPLLSAGAALLVWQGPLNRELLLLLNRLGQGDPVLWTSITILGDGLVGLALLLPLQQRNPRLAWVAILAGLIGALLVHLLKPMLDAPRPPALLSASELLTIGPAYHSHSFPSGHSATIFALAGVLSLAWLKHPLRVVALIALATLVGLSRSVVGVHWPVDILAGASLGWIAAILATRLAERWRWGEQEPGRSRLTVFLLLCALALLLIDHTGYPMALAFQQAIALICLLAALLIGVRAAPRVEGAAGAD
ncbi:phosphatase PAP2 family protein [Candidatus Endoriftia persephone]